VYLLHQARAVGRRCIVIVVTVVARRDVQGGGEASHPQLPLQLRVPSCAQSPRPHVTGRHRDSAASRRRQHCCASHGMVFNWNGITWSRRRWFKAKGPFHLPREPTRSTLSTLGIAATAKITLAWAQHAASIPRRVQCVSPPAYSNPTPRDKSSPCQGIGRVRACAAPWRGNAGLGVILSRSCKPKNPTRSHHPRRLTLRRETHREGCRARPLLANEAPAAGSLCTARSRVQGAARRTVPLPPPPPQRARRAPRLTPPPLPTPVHLQL
jgi:hypothetical protein